jgi:hypothetical protein
VTWAVGCFSKHQANSRKAGSSGVSGGQCATFHVCPQNTKPHTTGLKLEGRKKRGCKDVRHRRHSETRTMRHSLELDFPYSYNPLSVSSLPPSFPYFFSLTISHSTLSQGKQSWAEYAGSSTKKSMTVLDPGQTLVPKGWQDYNPLFYSFSLSHFLIHIINSSHTICHFPSLSSLFVPSQLSNPHLFNHLFSCSPLHALIQN